MTTQEILLLSLRHLVVRVMAVISVMDTIVPCDNHVESIHCAFFDWDAFAIAVMVVSKAAQIACQLDCGHLVA